MRYAYKSLYSSQAGIPRIDKWHHLIRRQRPAVKKSLEEIAAKTTQVIPLGFSLDPFGDGFEPQAAGHADDGTHNGFVVLKMPVTMKFNKPVTHFISIKQSVRSLRVSGKLNPFPTT